MMRTAAAVLECDLAQPFAEWSDLHHFSNARVLCRAHGRPIGWVEVPVEDGTVSRDAVMRGLLDDHVRAIAVLLARDQLEGRGRVGETPDVEQWLASSPPAAAGPLVTVAVCTRDRPSELRQCLDALTRVTYPNLDLLVVDNAPSDDETERLVRDRYPRVRYVREPRPGLDWARNRAVHESRGAIVAFTDDDVVVDPGWVSALVAVFEADPEVMAVTGLVLPHELDTQAQCLFEIYGGFGRGFVRRFYRGPAAEPVARVHGGAGKFGTGANMAFRRELFDRVGGFDPALDVGTPTNGGGDLEMFFRVLKSGCTLVYEPAAIVRHRHRRTYGELRRQIANNGVGFYAYLTRTARAYADEWRAVWRLGLWWFWWWNLRRIARRLLRKERVPLDLMRAELIGSLVGLRRYPASRRRAAEVQAAYPNEPLLPDSAPGVARAVPRRAEAVRVVDLAAGVDGIDDARDYERLRIVVAWQGVPIGVVRLEHQGAPVSAMWLADAIAQGLAWEVLDPTRRMGPRLTAVLLNAALAQHLLGGRPVRLAHAAMRLADTPVSVVVATYDRPADLERCLQSLVSQRTTRSLEIVVVDNHPDSGLTRDVVAAFPTVRLVEERRGGLSYARNRGIAAATGDIIVATDDDVVCPPDWIERLVAPFAQGDVMVVTGNVLPIALENDAQCMFEAYGGLGRGFRRFRVDQEWFLRHRRAVPTWHLGGTANAAFRAGIFRDPAIGLLDEALGAGTPTGCSEDTYLFYRVLQAGYAIVYEPDAFVWHRHRATMQGLRKQLYAYSKGHVAYHLTTWLADGDVRGLVRVACELPSIHLRRLYWAARGWSDYPVRLLAVEILGNLAGPYALLKSRWRVRRLGPSTPIRDELPPLQNPPLDAPAPEPWSTTGSSVH